MSTGAPPTLRRITTRYVPMEDRIRLSGEIQAGQTVAVWLTLRLLQRLIPRLLVRLETPSLTSPHRDLLQEFAQARAVAAQAPACPVVPPFPEDAWLAASVTLGSRGHSLLLTFSESAGREAALALSPTALRQWLSIICRAYRQAAWPLDVWPAWILGVADGPAALDRPVMH